jgi:AcrR family transcriptional regulator
LLLPYGHHLPASPPPNRSKQRRTAILEAAAALFTDHDYDAVSLNAIARRAGLAKSALYRYFETKEEIFLQLYLEDLRDWIGAVELALAPHAGCNDPGRVARAFTRNLLRRPRLGTLQSLLSGVLERNVSVESVASFKLALIEPTGRLARRAGCRAARPDTPSTQPLPHLSTRACGRALAHGSSRTRVRRSFQPPRDRPDAGSISGPTSPAPSRLSCAALWPVRGPPGSADTA